ncbi:hypothetical protein QCN27_10380 [Cereibacter sp. SYSU M97828]|nr:hypothetical protein [Cereibacter flavus]
MMVLAALGLGIAALIVALRLSRTEQGGTPGATLAATRPERRRGMPMAAALVILWAALNFHPVTENARAAAAWPVPIASGLAAILLWLALSPRGVALSRADRALHRLAFAAPGLQKTLAQVESRRYAARIDPDAALRPVLVTSLARAGGSVLLDALAGQPEFASPAHRHMPFALSPLLWGNLTRGLRGEGRMERMPGDGRLVFPDSPAALEEMAWIAFWKDHYAADHIRPWTDRPHPEFEAFLRRYMANVVAAKPGASRYVARNDASVARLPWIARAWPDATVVIPLRDPFAHARSLLRQHRHITDLQTREPFARRYMHAIGQFGFGSAFRPLGGPRKGDPATPEFWLSYWADTYRMVLETAGPNAILVDQDALCSDPRRHLIPLAEALALGNPAELLASAPRFRPPRGVPPPESAPAALIACVHDIHAALKARCLRP